MALEADLSVRNEGTLFLLCPLTPKGVLWLSDSLDPEVTYWAGAAVVEHRYVSDIVEGAQRDGLVVV